jgi:ABC-2 type transport system permease protein
MKTFCTFLTKELLEQLRTGKIIIFASIFLFIAVLGPVSTYFMPDLMNALNIDGIMDSVIHLLPPPSAIESWIQFFSNVGQIGSVLLIIVFSGSLANELGKGTLIIVLTKGLKRKTVLLAKILAAVMLWSVSYLVCLGLSYLLTNIFWPAEGLHHVFLSFFALWVFGVLLIATLIFGGVLFKKMMGSLLMSFGLLVSLTVVNIIPPTYRFNPLNLGGGTMLLLAGHYGPDQYMPAMVISGVLIAALITASLFIFDKKEV